MKNERLERKNRLLKKKEILTTIKNGKKTENEYLKIFF